jgi:hypothetical protein
VIRRKALPSRRGARAVTVLLAVWLAVACSSKEIYDAAAGWRRNECYKIGDPDQRERCMKEADRPYDAYRAGTGKDAN